MSDAAAANASGETAPPARGGRLRAIGGFVWRFPFALFFAALASAALVMVVGLLIAFMQYQQRLLKVQQLMTAAEVVDYVATSNRLEERFSELNKIAVEAAALEAEYKNTLNEIRFRVDRICSLFSGDEKSLKDCRDYLVTIPFAGNARPAQIADVAGAQTPADGWWSRLFPGPRREPPMEMWPELSRSIKQRFVEIMGGADRTIAGAPLASIVALYTWELEEIARKNLKFWLALNGPYSAKQEQYRTGCTNLLDLASVVSVYRQVSTETCSRVLGSPPPLMLFQPADIMPPLPPKEAVRTAAAGGASPAASPAAAPQTLTTGQSPAAQSATQETASPAPEPAPVSKPDAPPGGPGTLVQEAGKFSGVLNRPILEADKRQIMFELVTNYSFYDRLLGSKLQGLLISPSDFLALALVCFAGVLGALLRIVFFTYVSGRDPNIRNIFIGPILGLICALVVYILFRAGFIVITDRGPGTETATLSPFVIAIISMSAGLLSERAIELFQRTGGTWLGSAEASQASRWAVRLQAELDQRNMALAALAQRLDVSQDKLADWAAEKDVVPIEKQREIALVLDVPVRQLFTDLPPATRTA